MNNEAITLTEEEITTLDVEKLNEIEPTLKKNRVYEDWIDDLSCESRVKNILKQLLGVTLKIYDKVYQIGKAILEFLMSLGKNYPKTFDLAAIAFILSLFLLMVPVVGQYLFPILCPLFVLVGAAIGLAFDLGAEAFVKSKIQEFFGTCKDYINSLTEKKVNA